METYEDLHQELERKMQKRIEFKLLVLFFAAVVILPAQPQTAG